MQMIEEIKIEKLCNFNMIVGLLGSLLFRRPVQIGCNAFTASVSMAFTGRERIYVGPQCQLSCEAHDERYVLLPFAVRFRTNHNMPFAYRSFHPGASN